MPSSLMARLKATEGAAASSASTSAGGTHRSHVVTPPPTSSSSSGSSRARPTSSLAVAAAGRSGPPKGSSLSAAVPEYVPQFKRNPLNANATAKSASAPDDGKETAAAAEATAEPSVKVPSAENAVHIVEPPTPTKAPIQQLLLHAKEPPPVPPAYTMCSPSEALDREEHLELSPLECHPGSASVGGMISIDSSQPSQKASRQRPAHHARYVVKKYRRSAAGGGTLAEESEKHPRTLDQLKATVDYLLGHVFANQSPPPVEEGNGGADPNADPNEISIWGDDTPVKQHRMQQHAPFSLSDTVAFVDDRLRAVQKDLVTLLGTLDEPGSGSDNSAFATRERRKQLRAKRTAREMQAKMVRYNILASYLLSELPSSKYEAKFGARALRTSLTCYLTLSTGLREEYNDEAPSSEYVRELAIQDEIMAYMALLHSSAVIRAEEAAVPPAGEATASLMEDSGSGWGAILSTFGKHAAGMVGRCPRWRWALDLACAAQEGNHQRYFALMEGGPVPLGVEAAAGEAEAAEGARFLVLARCCASRTLNLVRLAQVRRYNHAFRKGENVPAGDLARLLRFEDTAAGAERAVDLCRDAGLPVVEKEGFQGQFVAMKTAPIKIAGDEAVRRMCNPGRSNDWFVFGSKLVSNDDRVDSLANQLSQQCDVQDGVDDWEERETEPPTAPNGTMDARGRTDEDGVLIPSCKITITLIF